jgi:hypothetical protein
MQRVLDGWRDRLADPRLPRTLSRRLREAGLQVVQREAWTIFDPDGREGSYSARQIEHLGASAFGVERVELESWREDLEALARTGDYFFSVNRYFFLAIKPA